VGPGGKRPAAPSDDLIDAEITLRREHSTLQSPEPARLPRRATRDITFRSRSRRDAGRNQEIETEIGSARS
jgi:hypothetical protein